MASCYAANGMRRIEVCLENGWLLELRLEARAIE